MKKRIRQTEESNVKSSGPSEPSSTPLPQYLLDRSQPTNAKALSSAIKNKRNEKVGLVLLLGRDMQWLIDLAGSKIQRSATQGEGYKRGGDVQGCQNGQENSKESVEEDDYKADIWHASHFPPLHLRPELVLTCHFPVGPDFTRRPVKYERFIRPMGLRYKKAHVTHPELKVTVQLPIISVKKVHTSIPPLLQITSKLENS